MSAIKNKKILLIFILYTALTIFFKIYNSSLYANILNPLFWLVMIEYLIINIKENYIRFPNNRKFNFYMIIIASIHIVAYFYAGFMLGFSKNPYSQDVNSILKNLIIKVLPIVGIELARGSIIAENKHNKKAIILLTILTSLVEINYVSLFSEMSSRKNFFEYVCSTIIPLIAYQSLFTYLSLIGSYVLPLIFRIFSALIIIFLPILPNINWFVTGSASLLSATIVYALYRYKFLKNSESFKNKINWKKSFAMVIILLVLVCFMMGFFKYKAIVILSNSMFPVFSRGDILIYKKVEASELKNADIIIYKIENQFVAHRIINIINSDNNFFFQTKGDMNNIPDDNLVDQNQVVGVYCFKIKYMGFPAIWFNEFLNNQKPLVETK